MRRLLSILLLSIIVESTYGQVLKSNDYKKYVDEFNKNDNELYKLGDFPNEKAWGFLEKNIPLFDCPDKQLEKTYYFRWWTYRKHIRNTPEGHIITEFLPNVNWAGKYNSIACAAALHFMEGRWLQETSYFEEYARFWLKGSGAKTARGYSFWIANALENYTNVHPNDALLAELFPYLEQNFSLWEKEHRDSTGFFWQTDNKDGMEISISGEYPGSKTKGYRATINSYMFAEAEALKNLAVKLGDAEKAKYYGNKADTIKNNVNNRLWDQQASFYKVIPWGSKNLFFSDAIELHGYTPWYFNIPPANYSAAWKYLMDSKFFYAKYGPTTAAQNHPKFKISYEGHECQWNGPSWPFSTSITLTALANVLNNYQQKYVSAGDYYKLLSNYSQSHQITFPDGRTMPWIDENINPYTGDWISRTRLKTWENGTWSKGKGGEERGKDYNHSTFNDLIISGLIGVRPTSANELVINPLVPIEQWDYYGLDHLSYKGKNISIYYDKTGKHYNKKKGYVISVDGMVVHTSKMPQNVKIKL
ncbi:MGH1-like glycoside hydrolase domain-containing protein [Desertivirga arenae]|uniref:MGH1-like glycoside hydrolase domain-containing protein n=1 Tax=Desertivirga arenae TaxID=2810309 RepID=UPI001A976C3A|nr:amylo-alpha-1,6-glucosidase [Pedobacter sp. SYSU D00823]